MVCESPEYRTHEVRGVTPRGRSKQVVGFRSQIEKRNTSSFKKRGHSCIETGSQDTSDMNILTTIVCKTTPSHGLSVSSEIPYGTLRLRNLDLHRKTRFILYTQWFLNIAKDV